MANNFIQSGHHITVTAPADTASGDLVVIGDLVGVALGAALTGEELVLAIDGVWSLPKVTDEAATLGQTLYTDAGAALTPTDSGGLTVAGVAVQAAATAAASVAVLLGYPSR